MRKLAAVILALIALLVLFAFSGSSSEQADFVFISRGDLTTLDPQRMSWSQDLRIARLVYEGLVSNDVFTHDFKIIPAVADRWEISPDKKTYRFHIRDSARWSNSQPVTADDFVYSWRRSMLPDTASDYAAQFQLIRGAKAFYDWRKDQIDRIGESPFQNPTPDVLQRAIEDVQALNTSSPALANELANELAPLHKLLDEYRAVKDAPEGTLEHKRLTEILDGELPQQIDDLKLFRQALLDARKPKALDLWSRTQAKFHELVGLRSLDSGRILEVELERPTPYFLDLCAFGVFYPVYPPLVTQYERPNPETGRLELTSGWTKPGIIISNGPYELKRWRFKRDIRLEKNPNYWDRDSLAIDSMLIPSVEDPNAAVLAFTSGTVDWVSDVTPPYRRQIWLDKLSFYDEVRSAHKAWLDSGRSGPEPPDLDAMQAAGLDPIEIDARLPDDPRKNIHNFPAFGTYFYNFNCSPKLPDGRDNPFRDPRVRKAFTLAIDKQRIASQVRGCGETIASTLIPPGSILGYSSPKGLDYNPKLARDLLAQAGYPDGKGLPTIEILFNADAGHDIIAQAIAKDWENTLNIKITLAVREIKVFRNDLKQQNYMISRASWFGDYGDPTTFLDINRSNDGNNDRKYISPAYDHILDLARDEPDSAKRFALLTEAERLIMEDDLPMLPIFHYTQMTFFDPDIITGISSHPRQIQNLDLIDRLDDSKGPNKRKMLPPLPSIPSSLDPFLIPQSLLPSIPS